MLAYGSEIQIMRGKVRNSAAEDHESVYNIKFQTEPGYTLTVGYSRYKDGSKDSGITHSWVMFGENCNSTAKSEQAVDLLLSLSGYTTIFGSSSQPMAARGAGREQPKKGMEEGSGSTPD